MEQTSQASKKSSRKKRTIITGVIIILLLTVLFNACGNDPCSIAEDTIEKEGLKAVDSKIIAEQDDASLVAVDCKYDGSHAAAAVLILHDSDEHTVMWVGLESASGETFGLLYDDIPEMDNMEDALSFALSYSGIVNIQIQSLLNK